MSIMSVINILIKLTVYVVTFLSAFFIGYEGIHFDAGKAELIITPAFGILGGVAAVLLTLVHVYFSTKQSNQ